ncbi:MAG: hypothetical protein KC422_21530 [Trueperaceae bacterium]|nr:hypothetical protein [Trueperaceae bacterium]
MAEPEIFTYLLAILFFGMGVLGIGGFLGSLFQGLQQPFLALGALILGFTGLSFSLSIPFLKYEITIKGVKIRQLTGTRFISWNDMRAITAQPTFFGAYNFGVYTKPGKGKNAILYTSILPKHHTVAKAIIEAGTTSNPEIVPNVWVKGVYGPPPYGIFSSYIKESS